MFVPLLELDCDKKLFCSCYVFIVIKVLTSLNNFWILKMLNKYFWKFYFGVQEESLVYVWGLLMSKNGIHKNKSISLYNFKNKKGFKVMGIHFWHLELFIFSIPGRPTTIAIESHFLFPGVGQNDREHSLVAIAKDNGAPLLSIRSFYSPVLAWITVNQPCL